jgi:2-hydroxy fatty acid dioxygenase
MAYSASEFIKLHQSASVQQALILQAVAWIMQFVGHGAFERRNPAFFDNLMQSFSIAPFFVFLELPFALGYRPTLQKNVRARMLRLEKRN